MLLGAWVEGLQLPKYILDIGTGTGVLALMMAQQFPDAKITAVDNNPEACDECRTNVARSTWGTNIKVIEGDVGDIQLNSVDLIITNPPFFTQSLLSPDSSKNHYRHTVDLSFDKLILSCIRFLSETGILQIILPIRSMNLFDQIAQNHCLAMHQAYIIYPSSKTKAIRVMARYDRGVREQVEIEMMCLYDSNKKRTAGYVNHCRAFYL